MDKFFSILQQKNHWKKKNQELFSKIETYEKLKKLLLNTIAYFSDSDIEFIEEIANIKTQKEFRNLQERMKKALKEIAVFEKKQNNY